MRKTLFTLSVDNYAPDIFALTRPYMERYAQKIGAEFHVISERKFPDYPIVYEKFQVYELGRGNDWNLFVDGDVLIHPDTYDITEHVKKDTVAQWGADFNFRWDHDDYFRRDGRHLSTCNWFTLTSDWTHDFWTPLQDMTLKEALSHIHPAQYELQRSMKTEHFIDDYVLSRNLARYGLRYLQLRDWDGFTIDKVPLLYHYFPRSNDEKLSMLRDLVASWDAKVR